MSHVVVRNGVGMDMAILREPAAPARAASVALARAAGSLHRQTTGARYGDNNRRTSSGTGRPASWSLLKINVVSPNVCWITSWNPDATCVLTCRYQWPTRRAYASLTSAG